jgi:beta-glucosidase
MRPRVFIPVVVVILAAAALGAQVFDRPAYLDTALPFDRRADDLVARMTLDEKISQMMDRAPAIARLQVPAYSWRNEALHGVAFAGLATVFPQAIAVAATWDSDLVQRMASAISDEARAKHHDALRRGNHDEFFGLTLWSPNINLFRDPRWGRGQETYGEDPFLTGHLAASFVKGLQGTHPKYLKTVATVKHFAVHSGPEPDRHTFDAIVDERELHEDYLRHFETAVREGGAYSVMCAYNRVNGDPACSSDVLLRDVLRGAWQFGGYVVSDCGAIDDIYLRHRVVPTAAQAAAAAVKAGTDLECGGTYAALIDAVRQGLVSEAQIDTSLRRLFTARMKLGMFDPPSMVRYAQIPLSNVDSAEHRALAIQVARESIVLLKNDREVLPLRRDIGTLAVIGPNADDSQMLLGNYNGLPSDPITPLRGIRESVSGATKVLYAPGSSLAEGLPMSEQLTVEALDAVRQADAVVLCLGLTPQLEGEEMPVNIPGFRGGDRTAIELPSPQQQLLERVVATGKPTVLVLLNGSALAVDWAQQHVPAIVEAWYPGQAAGTAIADVLFGAYNPGGRLPVTFYRSTADLPQFEDYRMDGRTYRYFSRAPLYPFGYGLSYTTFRYEWLRTSSAAIRVNGEITVSVDVRNSGTRGGEEVVQLYVQHLDSKVPRPRIELRGYRRITLRPGERRTVAFTVRGEDLAYWDTRAHLWVTEPDRVRFRVGASSADLRLDVSVPVLAR